MARSINPKCQECCRLPIETAKALHGELGDGCWSDRVCHRRRSHYLNRDDNNQKRRGQYAQSKLQHKNQNLAQSAAQNMEQHRFSKSLSATIAPDVFPTVPPVALVYLYRERRKDAHLHAITVSVWQGDRKLEHFQPTHCMGMTNTQVRQYLQGILQELNQRYSIREFEPEIYRDPALCPIVPCPLKDQLHDR